MHSAFYDQAWPGNDAGDGHGVSHKVGSGDTRCTQLMPCVCPMLCFVGLLSATRELISQVFCHGGKRSSKCEIKCCNS